MAMGTGVGRGAEVGATVLGIDETALATRTVGLEGSSVAPTMAEKTTTPKKTMRAASPH